MNKKGKIVIIALAIIIVAMVIYFAMRKKNNKVQTQTVLPKPRRGSSNWGEGTPPMGDGKPAPVV